MSSQKMLPSQEFVYVRTYARWLEEQSRRESWPETVSRVVDFLREERPSVPDKVFRRIQKYMLSLDVLPSMRLVWAAGPAAKATNVAIYNCSFIAMQAPEDFAEMLYILMCGTGVGFSVEREYISKLPVVPVYSVTAPKHLYKVEDSKEGWANSLVFQLKHLFAGDQVDFDYSSLRPKGARLKTMGGRSSGPEPLIVLHKFVNDTFQLAQGRQLTSLEVHDICNKIAEIVVVGGVRRSSQISLSDLDDAAMRHAKDWPCPVHRFMANNSAVYKTKPSSIEFMKEWHSLAASGTGERGIFNLDAVRRMSPKRRKSNLITGTNPCGEIALRDKEFCNLSTVIVRPHDTIDTLLDKVETATWIGTIQASFTDFPYLRKEWQDNCREEALLGVSLSGQMDNKPLLDNPDFLKAMREKAIKVNRRAAKNLGISEAASITCGKPEGCQTADTFILSDLGILSLDEIGDVEGKEWQNISLKVDQDTGEEQMSDMFYVNGKKEIKIIKMKSGAVLKSTYNHMYRILHNGDYVWCRADKISVGDVIPYKVGGYKGGSPQELKSHGTIHFNSNTISPPSMLDSDFAYFLGIYFADGSNHAKGLRISGDKRKKEDLHRVQQILASYGLNPLFKDDSKTNKTQLYVNSIPFKEFLKNNGLLKQSKYTVQIPIIVRKSPASVLKSFLEGYQDGDGCETPKGNVVCTVSYQMARQLQVVGRAIGWAVTVNDMPPTTGSWGQSMRYRLTFRKGRQGDVTKTHVYAKFYKQLDDLELSDLVPDFVASIEDGVDNTYDISVPSTKTFIANSYISHNTTSQLTHSGSGCHPWYARHYIRRYRISAHDPLVAMLRVQGVPLVPEVGQTEENATTLVVEFPLSAPDGAVTRHEMSAMQQLEWYKHVQTNWCEHNQSITVYVRPEEWLSVGNWVYENWDIACGLSFLPYDGGHYQLAPYEEITKEKYEELVAKFPTIDYSALSFFENEDKTEGAKSYACTSGACEIV